MLRDMFYSTEYLEFEGGLSLRAVEKLRYAVTILETVSPIPSKFVKKLVNTDFYELRVSADNEIRVILFSLDNENINLASKVIFLYAFVKKDTKEYGRAMRLAMNILRRMIR